MDMSALAALAAQAAAAQQMTAAQAAAAQQMTALQNSALFPMQMQAFQGMPHPATATFVANAAQNVQVAQASPTAQFTQQLGFVNPTQAGFAHPAQPGFPSPIQAGLANPTQGVQGVPRMDREAPPSDNLYVSGLPPSANEEFIRGLFGQNVVQCRVLPSRMNDPGGSVALVRFSSVEEATNVRLSLDGCLLPGMDKSIQIRFNKNNANNTTAPADNLVWGKGVGHSPRPSPYSLQYNNEVRQANETLYVTGLPATVDADWLQQMFGPHGPIRDMKLLPQKGENRITRSALIRYDSVDQSSAAKTAVHGSVVPGCDGPILVEFSRPHMSMDHNADPEALKRIAPDMNVAEMDQQCAHKLLESMEAGRTGYPASWYWPKGKNKKAAAAIDDILENIHSIKCLPGAHLAKDVCALQMGGLLPDCDDLHLYRLLSPFGGIAPQGIAVSRGADGSCNGHANVTFTDVKAAASAAEVLDGFMLPNGTLLHAQLQVGMVQRSFDNQVNSKKDAFQTETCTTSLEGSMARD